MLCCAYPVQTSPIDLASRAYGVQGIQQRTVRHPAFTLWLARAEHSCRGRPQKGVDEATVLGKVNGHILPLFCTLAMLCYLDRVNLAFAARQLNEDLGFSKAVYGLGSGAKAGQTKPCSSIQYRPELSVRVLSRQSLGSSGARAFRMLLAASSLAGNH